VAPLGLAALACYVPLHTLPVAEKLLDAAWPQSVSDLLTVQIRDPREERELRSTFPLLNEIGPVSAMVREQYEQHPYPRWVSTAPAGTPVGINEYLRAILPLAPARPTPVTGEAEILIAGCGTGQQAIETALRYANARVLAVDLSLSSLSYARRKAGALGITNLEFAQADILKLGTIGRTFDLVASSGVVHHLSDPFGGWRTLVSLMRPDALMTIGVYSEVARKDITDARAFIAERGFRGTEDDDIRRCRQELIALDGGKRFENVWRSPDFFSMSACRDLLFHVNERNMTMNDIARFVADNDLQFLGFEIYPFVLQKYRERFPEDRTITDLASWDLYERENPSTFSGMYQFWLQRKN
jgi:SAM-dependent methyltransferase